MSLLPLVLSFSATSTNSNNCTADEWCIFLERRGGVEDVYFYAFMIFTSDDFNYLGKALPKEAQMDTGAIDENETLEDRVAKELAKQKERAEARKRQRAAKKIGHRGVMLQMMCLESLQALPVALHFLALL
jgi:hypothetical protein